MLAGSHRNAWPDETGTGGRTNRNTQLSYFSYSGLVIFYSGPIKNRYFMNNIYDGVL